LIVDEDRNVLALAGIVLVKLGYKVYKARSANEALDLFQGKKRLDLLVTDVRLGPVDGPRLAALLKIGHPALAVLYIGGKISDASPLLADGKTASQGYFLHKPFLPGELAEMAGAALNPAGEQMQRSLSEM
jgi:DNA-binding NtrC family response regulator